MKDLTVVMVGLGYIGLPTAALIASRGIRVLGVDINPSVVETINQGKIHIIEPDLDGLVRNDVERGLLKASTQPIEADVYLIAVPTPFKDDHEPDISYVESAVRLILPYLKEDKLIILESTSPVGTTEKMQQLIYHERPELKGKLHIAYCPERVLPGRIIYELENNDRVIGGLDEAATQKAMEFYSAFVKGTLHPTNARTAEMCKLVENASRDLNIAFANELSMICDKVDINVWELISLANRHPRVNILQPGPGVGGHCIAVDPWFLVHDFPQEAKVIRTAREVNDYKTEWLIAKIERTAAEFQREHKRDPKIACLGLAFKADIDDLRESPALEVTQHLVARGYHILAVEPNIEEHPTLKLIPYQKALVEADILVFLVRHKEFRNLRLGQEQALIIDSCGVLKAQ